MSNAQFIPIAEWAKNMFGDSAPHIVTLREWVHKGKISPRPMKVGRAYLCRPDAEFVDSRANLLNRINRGR